MKKIIIIASSVIGLFLIYMTFIFLQTAAISQGTPIAAYPAPTTAVLVIDIQKDMTEKNGKAPLNLAQTDAMIPVVNTVISAAEQKHWLVVYITHENQHHSFMRLVTRDILLEGLPGAAMDARVLKVSQNHFIKHKLDAFSNQEFEAFLGKNQVSRLIVTGMAAEACVDRTSRAALNRKYDVTIVSDAIAAMSDHSRQKKIMDYQKYGIKVITAQAVIAGN